MVYVLHLPLYSPSHRTFLEEDISLSHPTQSLHCPVTLLMRKGWPWPLAPRPASNRSSLSSYPPTASNPASLVWSSFLCSYTLPLAVCKTCQALSNFKVSIILLWLPHLLPLLFFREWGGVYFFCPVHTSPASSAAHGTHHSALLVTRHQWRSQAFGNHLNSPHGIILIWGLPGG